MVEEKIETLLAEAGKKFEEDGQAIASLGRSIIFLPQGCEPGKQYRLKLRELREDARGRMMFRAMPADDEYTERWKDNGNGTLLRVTICTGWKLEESEIGVVETRKSQAREGTPSTQSNYHLVWGIDSGSSIIEDHQVNLIPLEEEKVEGGQLVWQKTGERQEPMPILTFAILRLEISSSCDWYCNRLQVSYDPTVAVKVTARFQRPDSSWEKSHDHQTTWQEMPVWWQKEQEARYQVCSCGRQRHDTQIADGFAKCELCRTESICNRCGKQAKITVINNRLICATCQPCEEQEELIAKFLSPDQRQKIAEEATKLLAGQAMTKEEGEVILKATLDHIASSWTRDDLIRKWSGFGWYYFTDEGVYGSKLAPAALQILQFLPQASGNGLVEMVGWLTSGPKPRDESRDFYLRTQVKGESGVKPEITENLLKQVGVADFLRGSEADRQAALRGYQNLVATLGEDAEESKKMVEILQGNEQDYAKAIGLMVERQKRQVNRQAQAAANKLWLEVEIAISTESRTHTNVWAINPDGSIIDPQKKDTGGRKARTCGYFYGDLATDVLVLKHSHDNYGYRLSESWEVCYVPKSFTPEQEVKAREAENETRTYFAGPGTGFDLTKKGLVAFTTEYSRDLYGENRQTYERMCSQLPIDVSQWKTTLGDENGASGVVVWAEEPIRSEEERKLRELARNRERYEMDLCGAEEMVAVGYWVQLSFRKGKNHKSGETQWEAGTKQVKYVLDRFSNRQPEEGRTYFCSLEKKLVDSKTFQLQLVKIQPPYPEDKPTPSLGQDEHQNSPIPGTDIITEGSDNISSLEDLKKRFQR